MVQDDWWCPPSHNQPCFRVQMCPVLTTKEERQPSWGSVSNKGVFHIMHCSCLSAPSSFATSVLSSTSCGGSRLVGTSTGSDCIFVACPQQPIHPGFYFPLEQCQIEVLSYFQKGFFPPNNITWSSGEGIVACSDCLCWSFSWAPSFPPSSAGLWLTPNVPSTLFPLLPEVLFLLLPENQLSAVHFFLCRW